MKKHKKSYQKKIIALIAAAVAVSIIVVLVFIFAMLPNIAMDEENVVDEKNCHWCDKERCVNTFHCEIEGS